MYLCLFLVMHVAVDTVTSNSALITVLRQEIDRYNNLLFVIQASLKDLILAIKGEVIMSEPLEEAYNAILSQKIPQRWKVNTQYRRRYEYSKTCLKWPLKKKTKTCFVRPLIAYCRSKVLQNAPMGAFCNSFDLH